MRAILLALLHFSLLLVHGLVEIKKLDCITVDKSFSDFEYCYIRAINRTYKYFSVKVNLLKVPVDNITVTIDIRKWANGYKPFLYNISADACRYLRRKKNPVYNYFYSFIETRSNMNHTCPYDHPIILDKLDAAFANDLATKVLPVPEGNYAVLTTWSAYNVVRARVNAYGTLS